MRTCPSDEHADTSDGCEKEKASGPGDKLPTYRKHGVWPSGKSQKAKIYHQYKTKHKRDEKNV